MTYPSTLQYIETLENPDGLFQTLVGVQLVDGISCSGNFGTVFKIKTSNGIKALKCFTRNQHGRIAAYRQISESIHPSQYIIEYKYLNDEIYVFRDSEHGEYYPVVLMEWVNGETLGKHIEKAININNLAEIQELALKFENLSEWLLHQPFAMGDLKPDNIMVRQEDKSLVLIDYDGMFVESMAGEQSREFGTEPFQSPSRMSSPFDRNIDNYSIAYIRKAFEILIINPERYSPQHLINFTPQEMSELDNHDTFFGTNFQYLGVAAYGIMIYKEHGKYGFVTQSGHKITDPRFDKVEDFSENAMAAVCINGKWGYLDILGKVRIPLIYDSCSSFSEGKAAVRKGAKWGYINTEGETVSRFIYDNAWSYHYSLAVVCRNSKYGYLGEDGRVAISLKYDYAQNFTEDGLGCVKVNDKWGYIDRRGKWWEQPIYDYAQSFHQKRAAVEYNGREFYIKIQ